MYHSLSSKKCSCKWKSPGCDKWLRCFSVCELYTILGTDSSDPKYYLIFLCNPILLSRGLHAQILHFDLRDGLASVNHKLALVMVASL